MRKKRELESAKERVERVNRNEKQRGDSRAADEDAIDARVRLNIEQHGP